MEIKLTRTIPVPDPVKTARFAKSPDLGPRILFFSGGTALRKLSRHIIRYTHNSIHVITPFDSGGSSAHLRRAFNMPAIGDIRNRIMALADNSLRGNPAVVALFTHRLPRNKARETLLAELENMAQGRHRLVARVPDPMRKIIRNHLQDFLRLMPEDFELKGASIGNLVLSAGYLANRRLLDPVIYIFSRLVRARGEVRPVINKHLNLVAELEDGTVIPSQHLLTGKECDPIPGKVKDVWISGLDDPQDRQQPPIRNKMKELIGEAELICYPMGSFYSSLIANLLPKGVGRSVAANPCPKVFVPNTDRDPEARGTSVGEQAERIVRYAGQDDPHITPSELLNFVVVDRKNGRYPEGLDLTRVEALGCRIIDTPLITKKSAPYIDETLLAPVLLSLT